jgi:hypothetical protein
VPSARKIAPVRFGGIYLFRQKLGKRFRQNFCLNLAYDYLPLNSGKGNPTGIANFFVCPCLSSSISYSSLFLLSCFNSDLWENTVVGWLEGNFAMTEYYLLYYKGEQQKEGKSLTLTYCTKIGELDFKTMGSIAKKYGINYGEYEFLPNGLRTNLDLKQQHCQKMMPFSLWKK